MIKMATITLRRKKTIIRKFERRIKRNSVTSFFKRLLPSAKFEQTTSQKIELNTMKELRSVMAEPFRVNMR